MKPAPIILPPACAQRVGPELAARTLAAEIVAPYVADASPLAGLLADVERIGRFMNPSFAVYIDESGDEGCRDVERGLIK